MRPILFSTLLRALLLFFTSAPLFANLATGDKGIVASVHPLATQAGIAVLRNGGNAIDAAVAVALTLGVVDNQNSGLGGGCFMLIRLANGQFVALDGRETAPARATRDMFVRDGKGDTSLSQDGPLASGVPGALAVYEQAARLYGRQPLSESLLTAAKIAEDGFPISAGYARLLKEKSAALKRYQAPQASYFRPDGTTIETGDLLRQPDLARSHRAIAADGIKWFYRGAYARAAAGWMRQNGGLLTQADFAGYSPEVRHPVISDYRGYKIVGFPPPSSGGAHVAEILNILENFDLKGLKEPGAREHVMAEAMKLAFADRAYWLGDPDFTRVPLGLVDKSYARELSRRIDLGNVTRVLSHGMPPDADARFFGKHTTHFCTADSEGNWVACTATINTSFGSKVIIPGTGIFLNNEMDDFSIQAGAPNAFGLVGAEANAVAPGKRPLSSMSPTIVLQNNQPILALGAAGGPTIISQTVLNLVGILDLGMTLDEALAQPRLHQQWAPDQLLIEKALPGPVRSALVRRGHKLVEEEAFGVSQAVGWSRENHVFSGASDTRAGGSAAGW